MLEPIPKLVLMGHWMAFSKTVDRRDAVAELTRTYLQRVFENAIQWRSHAYLNGYSRVVKNFKFDIGSNNSLLSIDYCHVRNKFERKSQKLKLETITNPTQRKK